jgi:acyl-CoA synthetase (AMP-forming)/AMP-acid ligase II
MLEWTDLRRGIRALLKKKKPLARTVVSLLRYRERHRLSLGALIERAAKEFPDHIAIKFEDRAITYATFNEQVNRLAHELIGAGLKPGQAVAIFMDSRPELLAVVAAVAKAGGIAGMINSNQRQEVLLHSLRCCATGFHVIGEELIAAFEDIRPQLGEVRAAYVMPEVMPEAMPGHGGAGRHPDGYIDLQAAAQRAPATTPPVMAGIKLGDPCFYIFTSGTTGLPKASIMSHHRWFKAGATFGNVGVNLQPGETIYAPLPLYHNQALTLGWSSAVVRGAALAIRRKFSASEFWDDCRRFDASSFVYIGEIPRYLLNQPESERDRDHPVRRIVGVGLRPDIWQTFKQRFGIDEIYEIYAASEMNVAFLNAMNLDCTVGLCPMPWALVEFDVDAGEPVRDLHGRFIRVGKGQVGLIITKVSDRFKFEGYTDSQASERKLFRDVFKRGDVWYNSGDLMRDIGFGHLQFVDRVGDTFRWKSENVSTSEVEQVLGSVAAIAESTVYGVEIPGAVGRAGMAAVVPADRTRPIDLEELLAHMNKALPGYAVPVFVRVTDTLEVTGTFKHRKIELRKQGYDPAVTDDPIFVLLPAAAGYCRLTPQLHAAIMAEQHRF